MKQLFVFCALLVLSACVSGKHMVVSESDVDLKVGTVALHYEESSLAVPHESSDLLQRKLHSLFYAYHSGFAPGDDLNVHYRFVRYQEGSRAARYLLGPFAAGSASDAVMEVEARFLNADGEEIAVIRSEGALSGGLFGGSADAAISKTAEEIANFARVKFSRLNR